MILIFLCSILFFSGCRETSSNLATLNATALDRHIVGLPSDYIPQNSKDLDRKFVPTNRNSIRKLGWSIFQDVTQAKVIRDKSGQIIGEIPLFLTWYDRQDLLRLSEKLFTDLKGHPAEEINSESYVTNRVMENFQWNVDNWKLNHGTPGELTLSNRIKFFQKGHTQFANAGSLSRTLWSPSLVKDLLVSFKKQADCGRSLSLESGATKSKQAEFTNINSPEFPKRPPCFQSEFKSNAVAVKALWRLSASQGHQVFDTSPESINDMIQFNHATWRPKSDLAVPSDQNIIRQVTQNGKTYDLLALHIMTKELSNWAWVTLWWSPDADAESDFGSDRPKSIDKRWKNYKMCSVVHFEDQQTNANSWCSNPYLETASGLGDTNCIGCHQFAGHVDNMASLQSRELETKKIKMTPVFPTDYLWSVSGAPEAIALYFHDAVEYFNL
ncbi:MAG: hypothetical protein NT027_16475 [Proteobacteria bacterium]|nr:hypothetical protein [Pseudomonadota bacterium]